MLQSFKGLSRKNANRAPRGLTPTRSQLATLTFLEKAHQNNVHAINALLPAIAATACVIATQITFLPGNSSAFGVFIYELLLSYAHGWAKDKQVEWLEVLEVVDIVPLSMAQEFATCIQDQEAWLLKNGYQCRAIGHEGNIYYAHNTIPNTIACHPGHIVQSMDFTNALQYIDSAVRIERNEVVETWKQHFLTIMEQTDNTFNLFLKPALHAYFYAHNIYADTPQATQRVLSLLNDLIAKTNQLYPAAYPTISPLDYKLPDRSKMVTMEDIALQFSIQHRLMQIMLLAIKAQHTDQNLADNTMAFYSVLISNQNYYTFFKLMLVVPSVLLILFGTSFITWFRPQGLLQQLFFEEADLYRTGFKRYDEAAKAIAQYTKSCQYLHPTALRTKMLSAFISVFGVVLCLNALSLNVLPAYQTIIFISMLGYLVRQASLATVEWWSDYNILKTKDARVKRVTDAMSIFSEKPEVQIISEEPGGTHLHLPYQRLGEWGKKHMRLCLLNVVVAVLGNSSTLFSTDEQSLTLHGIDQYSLRRISLLEKCLQKMFKQELIARGIIEQLFAYTIARIEDTQHCFSHFLLTLDIADTSKGKLQKMLSAFTIEFHKNLLHIKIENKLTEKLKNNLDAAIEYARQCYKESQRVNLPHVDIFSIKNIQQVKAKSRVVPKAAILHKQPEAITEIHWACGAFWRSDGSGTPGLSRVRGDNIHLFCILLGSKQAWEDERLGAAFSALFMHGPRLARASGENGIVVTSQGDEARKNLACEYKAKIVTSEWRVGCKHEVSPQQGWSLLLGTLLYQKGKSRNATNLADSDRSELHLDLYRSRKKTKI